MSVLQIMICDERYVFHSATDAFRSTKFVMFTPIFTKLPEANTLTGDSIPSSAQAHQEPKRLFLAILRAISYDKNFDF